MIRSDILAPNAAPRQGLEGALDGLGREQLSPERSKRRFERISERKEGRCTTGLPIALRHRRRGRLLVIT